MHTFSTTVSCLYFRTMTNGTIIMIISLYSPTVVTVPFKYSLYNACFACVYHVNYWEQMSQRYNCWYIYWPSIRLHVKMYRFMYMSQLFYIWKCLIYVCFRVSWKISLCFSYILYALNDWRHTLITTLTA